MTWENVDKLQEKFEKLTKTQKLDYFEELFGEQLGYLWRDWEDELVEEELKRLDELIELKEEETTIKLLREISAELQEKCEDNEYLRAEIEDYFEDKINNM